MSSEDNTSQVTDASKGLRICEEPVIQPVPGFGAANSPLTAIRSAQSQLKKVEPRRDRPSDSWNSEIELHATTLKFRTLFCRFETNLHRRNS
jgi:hypothetical protein